MCTIVALFGVRRDYPLVLATNRDEFFARPSAGPARLLDDPVTVGGRDLHARGTWMGVTREGLFVGVTNQRTHRPPDPGKRSRGELVIEALQRRESGAILDYLRGLDGRDYNGFNLMFGGATALHAAYGREDRREIEIEAVAPGVHVLPNDRLDAPDFWKVSRARELLRDGPHLPFDALRDRLQQVLRDTTLPPPEAVPVLPEGSAIDPGMLRRLMALCVQTPSYGTRSSTVVALSERAVGEYWFADGPPDQTEFVDVTRLF
jgi:uncharacterized protein with NRDE domain